jgi:hypothetical protein
MIFKDDHSPRRPSKVDLWCKYNKTYHYIRSRPALYSQMRRRKDPGLQFMERGWLVVFIILAIIGMIGRLA